MLLLNKQMPLGYVPVYRPKTEVYQPITFHICNLIHEIRVTTKAWKYLFLHCSELLLVTQIIPLFFSYLYFYFLFISQKQPSRQGTGFPMQGFQLQIYWVAPRHCVNSVQIRSYFWSVFSCIQSEYRKIRTRNNSVFGHFSRSVDSAFHSSEVDH